MHARSIAIAAAAVALAASSLGASRVAATPPDLSGSGGVTISATIAPRVQVEAVPGGIVVRTNVRGTVVDWMGADFVRHSDSLDPGEHFVPVASNYTVSSD